MACVDSCAEASKPRKANGRSSAQQPTSPNSSRTPKAVHSPLQQSPPPEQPHTTNYPRPLTLNGADRGPSHWRTCDVAAVRGGCHPHSTPRRHPHPACVGQQWWARWWVRPSSSCRSDPTVPVQPARALPVWATPITATNTIRRLACRVLAGTCPVRLALIMVVVRSSFNRHSLWLYTLYPTAHHWCLIGFWEKWRSRDDRPTGQGGMPRASALDHRRIEVIAQRATRALAGVPISTGLT